MTSPKSEQKNNKKYDFDFCQIIKIKYFLTSFKSEQKIKLFSDFDFFEKYFTLWFRKKPQIMVANKYLKMSKGWPTVLFFWLTPIWGILGMSGSIISGQKIESYCFSFDDVIPDRTFFFMMILDYVSNTNYTLPGEITWRHR